MMMPEITCMIYLKSSLKITAITRQVNTAVRFLSISAAENYRMMILKGGKLDKISTVLRGSVDGKN